VGSRGMNIPTTPRATKNEPADISNALFIGEATMSVFMSYSISCSFEKDIVGRGRGREVVRPCRESLLYRCVLPSIDVGHRRGCSGPLFDLRQRRLPLPPEPVPPPAADASALVELGALAPRRADGVAAVGADEPGVSQSAAAHGAANGEATDKPWRWYGHPVHRR
jgi:hypothetical protein